MNLKTFILKEEQNNQNYEVEKLAFEILKEIFKETNFFLFLGPNVVTRQGTIEVDIFLAHPIAGIVVIQVKAWDKEFIDKGRFKKDGKFYGKNAKYGSNPVEEVKKQKDVILNTIKTMNIYKYYRLPVVSLFFFPNLTEAEYDNLQNEKFKRLITKDSCIFKNDKKIIDKIALQLGNFHLTLLSSEHKKEYFKEVIKQLIPNITIKDGNIEVLPLDRILLDKILARNTIPLTEGYRIIKGPAGTPKTENLITKAIDEKLKNPHKRILIVVYENMAVGIIKQMLRKEIKDRNLKNISVDDFEIKTTHFIISDLYKKLINKNEDKNTSYKKVNLVLELLKKNPHLLPKEHRYDVILCEETEDYDKEFMEIIRIMAQLQEKSIVLFSIDELHRVHNRNKSWELEELGSDPTNRVTVLNKVYQIPSHHVELGLKIIHKGKYIKDIIFLKTKGEKIDLHITKDEFTEIRNQIKYYLSKGYKPGDLLILVPNTKMLEYHKESIEKILPLSEIQVISSAGGREDKYPDENKLIITTYGASRLLKRKIVMVAGVHLLSYQEEYQELNRKLLYSAVTKATEKLIITAQKDEGFVKEIKEYVYQINKRYETNVNIQDKEPVMIYKKNYYSAGYINDSKINKKLAQF